MFRSRSKEPEQTTAPATDEAPARDPQAPKGRPTPKRREALAQRKVAVKPPANRKEAARRAREARKAQLAKQREALISGDERYLPYRDRGPVRRFARDFVDARWQLAEWFLPIAVAILILSMFPAYDAFALLAWALIIVLIVVDETILGFRLRGALRRRFPDENRKGAVFYAILRTLQMRRLRLPKPQVKRGDAPRD
ncbi:DUF3043 domain-containing protein [Streptomyces sp. YIM 98790]|uniref:DUF3043 domain-containing protein n=1 Tax=Streptomyces sp. YIM 98790 TaxID=2689077 RepID=UPI00140D82A3|nr:DUF3043 domain-containing protein [Streptomyces sp. YIM 98790]